MTNLIYSVVTLLVTNVSTTDNATYEQLFEPCPQGVLGCLVIHGQHNGRKLAEATEQTTTYNVVREERLYARFCEACEEMQAKTVTPVTNWSVVCRLDRKWVPVATNAQTSAPGWSTNFRANLWIGSNIMFRTSGPVEQSIFLTNQFQNNEVIYQTVSNLHRLLQSGP